MFLLLLVAPALRAKEQPISAVVNNATYVMVTSYSGDRFSPDILPDDRQAIADVQQAIEKWGRYKLVYKPGEADLILVVRTGRAAEVRGGVQVGSSTGPRGSGQSIGAEAGDPQDTLSVYMASQGIDGTPLWRSRAEKGLAPPEMRLVKEFRSKVEAAAKKP
jgi:hypothetical protein